MTKLSLLSGIKKFGSSTFRDGGAGGAWGGAWGGGGLGGGGL